ncbi:unnamed protein product [Rodentolepis nana]|uniref:Coiled-coil domain-containing protein 130 n=1 Tax=Rodentolepis nana TaxID=102285 RepID=A0A0R3T2J0_RODNA|nr:unnamed protein product [Rodentolepis nana]
MGERKGTNKYYPPDFDPSKHRSLNAYHGVHALRERGRKADKGIIIIRFEMPYNAWCLSCKQPIGMGVRYNAEKTKVGMYHSTPIFEFSMNCAMCAGKIVMRTDPQNFDYICVEGIRRKIQTWDPEENEQILVPDFKERQKLSLDAMYQVEYSVKDKEKAALTHPAIAEIEANREGYKDDFELNYIARKQFRENKKLRKAVDKKDEALKSRLSLSGTQVNLLPEKEEDEKKAKLMCLLHTKHVGKSIENKLKPLIETDKPSTSKRKAEGSHAFEVTKERVTSHWLQKRANAFDSSEIVSTTTPSAHESLSKALKEGKVRKTRKEQTNPPVLENANIENSLSSLVSYEDSD